MKTRSRALTGLVVVVGLICASIVAYWTSCPKPLYGHVVLGPDDRIRIQFIACGPDLYLDRNQDNVPQRSEFVGKLRIEFPIERTDPNSSTRYIISGGLMFAPERLSAGELQQLDLNVDVLGSATYRQGGGPILADSPHKPGLAHFDGPLAIRVRMRDLRLRVGAEPIPMRVEVSTYRPELGGWAVVYSNQPGDRTKYAFPPHVAPEVEIDFPAKAKGAPSIRRRFQLNKFCCATIFHGPVRVPDDAGTGIAKATFTFDSWVDIPVAPLTVEIPIVGADAE